MADPFLPNPKAVGETVAHMLGLRRGRGGGRDTIDDACWWAWEHAFAYDRSDNGHKFWRAVYDELDQKRKQRGT